MGLTGYNSLIVGNHTTNSSLSSAVTLTTPSGGDVVQLQAFAQNIRYTTDGTTPTATTGFQITAGSLVVIDIGPNQTLKVIEETASASIQYQWFRTLKDQDA